MPRRDITLSGNQAAKAEGTRAVMADRKQNIENSKSRMAARISQKSTTGIQSSILLGLEYLSHLFH